MLDRVRAVDRLIGTFRSLQMDSGISAQHFRESKANLQRELRDLEAELNRDLAFEYGHSKPEAVGALVASHKPFHWFVEFHDMMQHGGFDVIIGDPPYVEYSKVKHYRLHAMGAAPFA